MRQILRQAKRQSRLLMILTAMLLTCCSSDSEIKAETNQVQTNMAKTLITYYSYTGNCKAIVNSLASQITADILEIEPAEKGLKYEANNYALGTQLLNAIKANPNDANSYPAIDPVNVSLDDYQNIIIVTPLWWNMTQKLYLTIGGVTKTATLVSNSSTEALVAQLQQGNITYEAHDYGNFEKVGPLGYTFPENNEQINTVPGDLILYQGSNLCIYYDTNSWNFTHIGKLDGMTQAEIKTWVNAGGGNVSVMLSISEPTGISQVKADDVKSKAYTLQGTLAQAGNKGIIIKNGKMIIR